MMFDFIIGNPPYQESLDSTSDKPIYNYFMDEVYKIGNNVELITPARFLFDAGKTPKKWNEKMLNDEHLKVLRYYEDSRDVFNGVNFAGGVAITYRNQVEKYGAIKTFIPNVYLRNIFKKVYGDVQTNGNLSDIMILQNRFDLESLFDDYPCYKTYVDSKGVKKVRTERRLVSSAITSFEIFHEHKEKDEDIQIIGIENSNHRIKRWVNLKYIEDNGNLNTYKVVVPKSYGSGLSENGNCQVIGKPELLGISIGYTQSFIGLGKCEKKEEAKNILKYLKSKFCRVCVGILKVTQDNPPEKWKYVPLQDFSKNSDIDWTKSVAEIDQQLYRKYGLDEAEINFIETKVKEME